MVTYMFGRFSVQTCSCNAFLNVAKAASVSDSGPLFRICFERNLGHLAERVGQNSRSKETENGLNTFFEMSSIVFSFLSLLFIHSTGLPQRRLKEEADMVTGVQDDVPIHDFVLKSLSPRLSQKVLLRELLLSVLSASHLYYGSHQMCLFLLCTLQTFSCALCLSHVRNNLNLRERHDIQYQKKSVHTTCLVCFNCAMLELPWNVLGTKGDQIDRNPSKNHGALNIACLSGSAGGTCALTSC
jgi:hypothetical protein